MADIVLNDMQQAAFTQVTKTRDETVNQLAVIDGNIALLQKERAKYQSVLEDAQAKIVAFTADVGGDDTHAPELKGGVLVLVDQVAKAAAVAAADAATEATS